MSNYSTMPWPVWQRIGFRFAFLFFGFVVFLVNNGAYMFWMPIQSLYQPYLQKFIVWVGHAVLHLPNPITVFTNGSGDTTFDWVLLLTLFVLAIAGTVVWSVVGRKQKAYPVWYYWLMVLLRYYVGLMLISYGLVKVIQLQFPSPGLYRLLQPYGNSSPMGLAWTFLGFSRGYNMFMGIAELAAGLLLFRRTTTVGAIITLMTTANVMAVNYFFDVPVKIVSTILFTFTLFILSRDLQRLFRFFFSGKLVELLPLSAPVFAKKWQRVSLIVAKWLIILSGPGLGFYEISTYLKEGEGDAKPGYFGLYQVETFVRNGDTLPPLRTDSTRWFRMAIENGYNLRVVMSNDSARRYTYEADTTARLLTISPMEDTATKIKLQYSEPAAGKFVLYLRQNGDSLVVAGRLIRDFKKEFLLTNRGFHWISEYPFNR